MATYKLLLLLGLVSLFTSACQEKGPAEKVGESLDDAAESVEDTIDKDSPVEKAAESVEESVEKVQSE